MPELLIPLTPGTSFSLSYGYGNVNERALIYCMIHAMDFIDDEMMDEAAQDLFYDGVKRNNWTYYIESYSKRIQMCNEEYVSKTHAKISSQKDFAMLLEKLKAYLLGEKKNLEAKQYILYGLRMMFA